MVLFSQKNCVVTPAIICGRLHYFPGDEYGEFDQAFAVIEAYNFHACNE